MSCDSCSARQADRQSPVNLIAPREDHCRSFMAATAACLMLAMVSHRAVRGSETNIHFDRDVRPLLSENCYACHGPGKQEAGLRLDAAATAAAVLESGARAIAAGKPAQSELVTRINASDPDVIMPPPESNKTLSAADKDLLTRWIAGGAAYEQHWSFRPIVRPAMPAGTQPNPIDRFIAKRLDTAALPVNAEADRPTLIRRLSFALTGLPPTPEEVDRFVADGQPGAYDRLVERLLASPHHGEEMARHWLDQARYADTHGLHLDNERQMWLYRDWVVKAFNDNLPFDQFTVWQLAGDLLPEATAEQQIATGFSRCNVTTSEGGSINEELVFRYAVDRTATMTNAFMGLTGQCAVCHSHKFDPLSQREFYSLYAFFNSAADPGFDGNVLRTAPTLAVPAADQRQQRAALTAEVAQLERAVDAAVAEAFQAAGSPSTATAVWIDDAWPGATVARHGPDAAAAWTRREPAGETVAPDAGGGRCLEVAAERPTQTVLTGPGLALTVPEKATLVLEVKLDPADTPGAVMVQLRSADWNHGVVWGDWASVPLVDNREKDKRRALTHADEPLLAGAWQRLSIPLSRLGLKPGMPITGLAIAQGRGRAQWDSVGLTWPAAKAAPTAALNDWWQQQAALADEKLKKFPAGIRSLLQQGPKATSDQAAIARVRRYWATRVWKDQPATVALAAAELDAVEKILADLDELVPETLVFNDLPTMRESFVMERGAYDHPGRKVQRGTPAFLPPLEVAEDRVPTRLDLARWLVSADHPLTARVAANRLWQQFFGTGLVKTHEDFGLQGEPPSHRGLLDWLAAEYRDCGWDTRRMVRLLVSSAAFRRASVAQPQQLARDPENRLLARGPRIRLDAEQIRDQALFVSGLLVPAMGGRGVKPYQPDNIWEPVGFASSNTRNYHRDSGTALYRRSLYTFLKRTAPPPFMANFDAPNREAFCARRERSNTPLQALQLMNDVQHVEAARALAARGLATSGADDAGRLAWLFRAVLARRPEPAEQKLLAAALAGHRARYETDTAAANHLISHGDSRVPSHIPAAELAAWTLLANTLLNLDEAVTRN